jgi:hypothetical protein
MQLSLFKKPEQKEFYQMTKPEKKVFLANDLIERMIHVEQKVRASMGEGAIAYYHTNYFKELHPTEKKRFIGYLKSKQVKQKWRFLPWVVLAVLGLFVGSRFTGNAIAVNGSVSWIDFTLIGVFILVLVFYISHLSAQKKRMNRLNSHLKVIDNILTKRRLKR